MNIKELLMTRDTIRVSIPFVSAPSHLQCVADSVFVGTSELLPLAFIEKWLQNNRNVLLVFSVAPKSQILGSLWVSFKVQYLIVKEGYRPRIPLIANELG